MPMHKFAADVGCHRRPAAVGRRAGAKRRRADRQGDLHAGADAWRACWSAPSSTAATSPPPWSPTRRASTASRPTGWRPATTRSRSAPSATSSTARRRPTSPPTSATTADLKLDKTNALANQLSNGEWLNSLPGDDRIKAALTNCVGCHTLQRIVQSTHNADEFMQVFKRMGSYSPGSTPLHPQPLLPGGNNSNRSPMPAADPAEDGRLSRRRQPEQCGDAWSSRSSRCRA